MARIDVLRQADSWEEYHFARKPYAFDGPKVPRCMLFRQTSFFFFFTNGLSRRKENGPTGREAERGREGGKEKVNVPASELPVTSAVDFPTGTLKSWTLKNKKKRNWS